MLDVLDAATSTLKRFAQHGFALRKRFPPKVVPIVHQKIERNGGCRAVIYSTVQHVEIRGTIQAEPDNLCVNYGRAFNPCRRFDNERIAFRPVSRKRMARLMACRVNYAHAAAYREI